MANLRWLESAKVYTTLSDGRVLETDDQGILSGVADKDVAELKANGYVELPAQNPAVPSAYPQSVPSADSPPVPSANPSQPLDPLDQERMALNPVS